MSKQQLVLLSAGSFNPVTFGHLLMLENVKNQVPDGFEITNGYISPVNQEYGKAGLLSPEHRLTMCKLGVSGSKWISVDPWEIKLEAEEMKELRKEYSCDPTFKGVPTVAVIQHVREKTGLPVGFVCGADLFIGFENLEWWTDNEIKLMVGDHLFVLERDDSDQSILANTLKNRPILKELDSRITFVKPTVRNDVSSSAVRKLIKNGKSVQYLIPEKVLDYIDNFSLYK